MPTYTVIAQADRNIDGATASPIAAIPGRVEAYGFGIYVATVDAVSADAAMDMVRGAACDPPLDRGDTAAATWTAIGLVDKGLCPSWSVVAIVPGTHEVEGHFESMLSYRWSQVIDDVYATSVDAAERVAWKALAELSEGAWD
jgi:hypothetical protein